MVAALAMLAPGGLAGCLIIQDPGAEDPGEPSTPNSGPSQGAPMGVVIWNNGAEAVSYGGLQGSPGSYTIAFSNEGSSEVLRFDFGVLAEGVQDLGGTNGRMFYDSRYYSTQEGGYARLALTDLQDGTVLGEFESRTCFKETPNANCFEQREGSFIVVNNSGVSVAPRQELRVAAGLPTIDAMARTKAEWGIGDGTAVATSANGVRPNPTSAGFELHFTRLSWQANQRFSVDLVDLEPGVYPLNSRNARITYANGNPYIYISDIDGGNGTVEILGRTPEAIWGTISAVVCYARTPGANCFTFDEIRFTAATGF